MEPVFYQCFNTIVTRCFGWGLPKTSLIPFADCINHHNVDSTYEFICKDLHKPIRQIEDPEDKYCIDINEFVKDNLKELKLDNPQIRDMDDASYYTKSKLMFDVSDLYDGDDEYDGDQINFKLNKNGIKISNTEN